MKAYLVNHEDLYCLGCGAGIPAAQLVEVGADDRCDCCGRMLSGGLFRAHRPRCTCRSCTDARDAEFDERDRFAPDRPPPLPPLPADEVEP